MIHHEQKYDCRLCSYCGKGHSGLKCDKQVISEQAEQITDFKTRYADMVIEKDARYNECNSSWQMMHEKTRGIVKQQAEQIARLKKELRHAYGEDKLDDFPKADEADEALDNLKQALAAQPQKGE